MPELPEVETVARGLSDSLAGRTFTGVKVGWQRTIARPEVNVFKERMAGCRVDTVGRRGKYVVIGLDQGYLLIHLKMSGRLRVVAAEEPTDKHTHVCFGLDDGRQLRFHDVRKFGRMHLVDDPELVTGGLGPEPLDDDWTLELFQDSLARRSGRLKSLLMNQSFLAGLGNIYADESLFAARLDPLRKANTLTLEEQARLYDAIRRVLNDAVMRGGTTLDDGGYVDAEGRAGAYQEQIAVYGRAGAPCPTCQTTIERIVVGGRSTHFCPRCQK